MQSLELVKFFSDVPLFEDLNDLQLHELSAIAKSNKYKRYEYIYSQGEDSDTLYFLKSGAIKIGKLADDGREVIKSIIHPKRMFGELSLMGQSTRNNYARTLNQKVECVEISIQALKQFMQKHPSLQTKVMKFMGERLLHMEKKVEALVLKDARSRIIDFIKSNAKQRGRKVGYETLFKHCMTQQEIANITGTSRQTVTSVLNELKKNNQIYFNRRAILVRDLEKLGN